MAKPTVAQCHALIDYYVKQYVKENESSPVLNRNKAKYGFEGILMDNSMDTAHKLIDYYIAHYQEPNIDWFVYNYDKVLVAMGDYVKQQEASAKRRQVTAQRLEEWRRRWQK